MYKQYIKDISSRNSDYKISYEAFLEYLEEHKEQIKILKDDLKTGDIYDACVDFAIPVIIIKKMIKEGAF